MTASWTTEPVFALIFVGRENHEVQSRRRRDSNPRPSDQGANALPLDHKSSTIYIYTFHKNNMSVLRVYEAVAGTSRSV